MSSAVTWSPKQAQLIMQPFVHTIDWLEGTPRSGKTTAGIARFTRHLIPSRDTNHLVTAYSAEQAYRRIIDGDAISTPISPLTVELLSTVGQI